MAKSREEKKKQKRKKKKKQAGRSGHAAMEHGWFHLEEANIFITSGHTKKAVNAVKKAARFLPHEEEVIQAMGAIAEHVKDDAMEVDAMNAMERIGKISDTMKVNKVFKLLNLNRYKQCRQEAEKLLKKFTDLKIDNKRKVKKNIEEIAEYCLVKVMEQEQEKSRKAEQVSQKIQEKKSKAANKTPPPVDDGNRAEQEKEKIVDDPGNQTPALHTQAVPVVCDVDEAPFFEALSDPVPSTPEAYELALSSHRIRFAESFESLVCLTSLTQVRSFWYQEETAKKVLKQFRGRALLSDEVGLG
ncbi:MAG TPA: ATP-dependent helicase, partial [Desulfobacteraceae bacterium]|nr:ATP-dependent helicase [Desulfobacteraceae bacterium]